jgi:hypothetical protein
MTRGAAYRGQGAEAGAVHVPHLTIRSFSSRGFASAVANPDGSRAEHVMSRLEKGYLLLKRRDPDVVERREQVPLHPVEETDEIARAMGIRPLRTPKRQPYVLTTDFVLGYRDGRREANFVRPVARLARSKRAFDKMMVERVYWARRGVDFRIVTDADVPGVIISNLEMLQDNQFPPSGFKVPKSQVVGLLALRTALDGRYGIPLCFVCRDLDVREGMPVGTHVALLKHFVFRRMLTINLYAAFRSGDAYRIVGDRLERMDVD